MPLESIVNQPHYTPRAAFAGSLICLHKESGAISETVGRDGKKKRGIFPSSTSDEQMMPIIRIQVTRPNMTLGALLGRLLLQDQVLA